jgi:hypothetical protein
MKTVMDKLLGKYNYGDALGASVITVRLELIYFWCYLFT